jgi:hypothetical protein
VEKMRDNRWKTAELRLAQTVAILHRPARAQIEGKLLEN